jgi:hypothetical protein
MRLLNARESLPTLPIDKTVIHIEDRKETVRLIFLPCGTSFGRHDIFRATDVRHHVQL